MRPSKSPSCFTAIASNNEDRAAADVDASRISMVGVSKACSLFSKCWTGRPPVA